MASGHGLLARLHFENIYGASAQSDTSRVLGKMTFNDYTTAQPLSGSSHRGPDGDESSKSNKAGRSLFFQCGYRFTELLLGYWRTRQRGKLRNRCLT